MKCRSLSLLFCFGLWNGLMAGLTGCQDAWQPDVCMTIASDCPVENHVQKEPDAARRGDVQTCHWLDSFKYLEIPEGMQGTSNDSNLEISRDERHFEGPENDKRGRGSELQAADLKSAENPVSQRPAVKKGPVVSGPSVHENPAAAEDCIDINLADEKALAKLPGIGTGKAKAIMASREKRPFRRKKDITRIKGIGPKSYQRMAGMICEIVPR